jgi:hypothetical protein
MGHVKVIIKHVLLSCCFDGNWPFMLPVKSTRSKALKTFRYTHLMLGQYLYDGQLQ